MTKLQTQAYQPLVSKPRCVFGVQPSLRCCKVARIQFGSDIQMSLEQHTHLNTLEHTHTYTHFVILNEYFNFLTTFILIFQVCPNTGHTQNDKFQW